MEKWEWIYRGSRKSLPKRRGLYNEWMAVKNRPATKMNGIDFAKDETS
jgi:hypothetical protein